MSVHVYILLCADGSFYTGSSPVFERRVAEHQAGEGGTWTAKRVPVRLVFSEEIPTLREAFEAERQIKGWRRAKKMALIEGKFELLPDLARTAKKRPD